MQQLFLILGLIFFAGLAQAQTAAPTPVPATLENIVAAAASLGTLDLTDDRVMDDYARIVHCDLYQRYHADEFAWRDVRAAMRQSLLLHKDSTPTSFYLYRTETFGPYDFGTHSMPLTGDATMRRTQDLEMMGFDSSETKICGMKLDVLPPLYVAVLDKAVQMEAIPMSEERAANLVKYFDAAGNGRLAYGRYLITLYNGTITSLHGEHKLSFGAHLDNIEFALDAGFQKIFWTGIDTPIITKAVEHLNSLNGIIFKGIEGDETPETPPGQPQP